MLMLHFASWHRPAMASISAFLSRLTRKGLNPCILNGGCLTPYIWYFSYVLKTVSDVDSIRGQPQQPGHWGVYQVFPTLQLAAD